jgi:hypothetical protein
MDADVDVENLGDVDDRDATVSSGHGGRDLRRGGVPEQDAEDRPGIDDYSP